MQIVKKDLFYYIPPPGSWQSCNGVTGAIGRPCGVGDTGSCCGCVVVSSSLSPPPQKIITITVLAIIIYNSAELFLQLTCHCQRPAVPLQIGRHHFRGSKARKSHHPPCWSHHSLCRNASREFPVLLDGGSCRRSELGTGFRSDRDGWSTLKESILSVAAVWRNQRESAAVCECFCPPHYHGPCAICVCWRGELSVRSAGWPCV